jgi:hypothetical protein
MATRYRCLVADEVLRQMTRSRRKRIEIEGLRLVSADEHHPALRQYVCTFEDDGASPKLEGKLVEVVFRREGDRVIRVMSRKVIKQPFAMRVD